MDVGIVVLEPEIKNLHLEAVESIQRKIVAHGIVLSVRKAFRSKVQHGKALDAGLEDEGKERLRTHLQGVIGDYYQRTEADPTLLKQSNGVYRLVPGLSAAYRGPLQVVKLLGAIDAQTDLNPVLENEVRPGLIQQSSVRLYAICDDLARAARAFLNEHRLLVEIATTDERFATVPDKSHELDATALKRFRDEVGYGLELHDAFGVRPFVTIDAAKVTDSRHLSDQAERPYGRAIHGITRPKQ